MRKKCIWAFLLLFTCSITASSFANQEDRDQESNGTVIEMVLTEDYDDTDPFVDERLFCVSADMNVLTAMASFKMDGESGLLEVKDNETKEVLWNQTWKESIDGDTVLISLDDVKKEKEYVICFTGTKINQAIIKVTFDSESVQERDKPRKSD